MCVLQNTSVLHGRPRPRSPDRAAYLIRFPPRSTRRPRTSYHLSPLANSNFKSRAITLAHTFSDNPAAEVIRWRDPETWRTCQEAGGSDHHKTSWCIRPEEVVASIFGPLWTTAARELESWRRTATSSACAVPRSGGRASAAACAPSSMFASLSFPGSTPAMAEVCRSPRHKVFGQSSAPINGYIGGG